MIKNVNSTVLSTPELLYKRLLDSNLRQNNVNNNKIKQFYSFVGSTACPSYSLAHLTSGGH